MKPGRAVLPNRGVDGASSGRTRTSTQEEDIMDAPQETENRRIVVGVDGSDHGLHAVRWAATEARLRRLPLLLLHAAPYAAGTDGPALQRALAILARAFTVARHAEPGLAVTTRHADEPARPSLLVAAGSARLLVLGMGGGDRPQDFVLGSTALDVSGRARCPVVVVRGREARADQDPVLVGVDAPASDATALNVAFADARLHGTGLVVVHARHGGRADHDEAARIAVGSRLAAALDPWLTRFPDVPVEVEVVPGQPAPALLDAARSARLLVVGTRGRGAPARALFGSTSREVLRRSPVPVIVVNPAYAVPDEPPTSALSSSANGDPHDRSQLW
jgi:nucleotide-binding universal stress UspA family protein